LYQDAFLYRLEQFLELVGRLTLGIQVRMDVILRRRANITVTKDLLRGRWISLALAERLCQLRS